MKFRLLTIICAAGLCNFGVALADFTLTFDSADFTTGSNYNDVANFHFEINVASNLVAGGTYQNPPLTSVDYTVRGVLNDPTPSGFPGFNLVRSITGTDFYSLSPEASIVFSVAAGADLSDGLQINELNGASVVFHMNARELNQAPGRYHPPILTLNADGSGQLVNANNKSTFPNPDPPIGSGELVDVNVGDEYDVALAFATSLSISGPVETAIAKRVPLPLLPLFLAMLATGLLVMRARVAVVDS